MMMMMMMVTIDDDDDDDDEDEDDEGDEDEDEDDEGDGDDGDGDDNTSMMPMMLTASPDNIPCMQARVEAARAYGEKRDDMIAQVPLSDAPGAMRVGLNVELDNGMPAVVTEVTDEFVTIDANHLLAGQVRLLLMCLSSPPSTALTHDDAGLLLNLLLIAIGRFDSVSSSQRITIDASCCWLQ